MDSATSSGMAEIEREQWLRLRAHDLGYVLRRSVGPRRGRAWREYQRDRGGWMILDAATDMTITGLHYELTLEDIEAFLDVRS